MVIFNIRFTPTALAISIAHALTMSLVLLFQDQQQFMLMLAVPLTVSACVGMAVVASAMQILDGMRGWQIATCYMGAFAAQAVVGWFVADASFSFWGVSSAAAFGTGAMMLWRNVIVNRRREQTAGEDRDRPA